MTYDLLIDQISFPFMEIFLSQYPPHPPIKVPWITSETDLKILTPVGRWKVVEKKSIKGALFSNCILCAVNKVPLYLIDRLVLFKKEP